MAPKKDQDTVAAEKIKTLCALMASATEFNPDFNVVASEIQLTQARNVTRKINSIIEPVGYTMKGKKITKINDDDTTPAAPDSDDDSEHNRPPAHKVSKAAAKAPAKPSGKKRRKMESSSEDEEDANGGDDGANDDDDSPANKAILKAMEGSDVEPGTDSD